MLRIRYRLRTLMIVVAFVALVLVVLLQGVYLKRAALRMEMHQAEAAGARAVAEMQRLRAEQRLAAAQATLEQVRADAMVTGDAVKTERGK
jgi:F0F1-type ATP synthase membrane subunit b/b'